MSKTSGSVPLRSHLPSVGDKDSPFGHSQLLRVSLIPWSPSDHRCSSLSLASALGEEHVMKLQQDDHQSADLAKVIVCIREFCCLELPQH